MKFLIISMCLFCSTNLFSQPPVISQDSVLIRVTTAGNYFKHYHTERKRALFFGGFFIAVGQIPLWTGIRNDEQVVKYLGYGTVGAGLVYFIVQSLHAERWLKRAGIELSGDGVKFLF